MRSGPCISNIGYLTSLRLLAAAACLWPSIAWAQPPNPTASDANGNTAAGTDALLNVTGVSNTAIGRDALRTNTTGAYNTAIGSYALFFNTTGSGNTASGISALGSNTTGSYNTANGRNALSANITGSANTAVGERALHLNTTGSDNTASGGQALFVNTIGSNNTANGVEALRSNGTGNFNTASGRGALRSNTTGDFNTASGGQALYSNTTGNSNTANGINALSANTTGSNNTANGVNALFSNTTGRNNTAVGVGALYKINGTNNIALGINAGKATPFGSNNIYIGHPGINASESRVTRIGTNQTKTFVAGIAGVPLSGATVVVRSNGQLGVVASSARYKQDIRPLGDASGKLARLRPVSYSYKAEPEAMHYGLIAEEVDKVMPELVVRDDRNRPESVQYLEIVPLLLQERREQQARSKAQEEKIATLERRLAVLEAALTQSPRREAAMRQAEPR
jgi:trimeric autotransporter adhesin